MDLPLFDLAPRPDPAAIDAAATVRAAAAPRNGDFGALLDGHLSDAVAPGDDADAPAATAPAPAATALPDGRGNDDSLEIVTDAPAGADEDDGLAMPPPMIVAVVAPVMMSLVLPATLTAAQSAPPAETVDATGTMTAPVEALPGEQLLALMAPPAKTNTPAPDALPHEFVIPQADAGAPERQPPGIIPPPAPAPASVPSTAAVAVAPNALDPQKAHVAARSESAAAPAAGVLQTTEGSAPNASAAPTTPAQSPAAPTLAAAASVVDDALAVAGTEATVKIKIAVAAAPAPTSHAMAPQPQLPAEAPGAPTNPTTALAPQTADSGTPVPANDARDAIAVKPDITATDAKPEDAGPAPRSSGDGAPPQVQANPAAQVAAPNTAAPVAAPASPAHSRQAVVHPVVEQIVIHLAKAAIDAVEQIKIELRPAELGRVDVRMEIGPNGHVQAVFAADRPQTVDLLQRDARQLERALQDAGLNVSSGSLSFDLRGNGRESGNNAAGFADPAPTPQLPELLPDLAAASQAYAWSGAGAGRLDIRV
jgi:flagellar hook-length control protein FliK